MSSGFCSNCREPLVANAAFCANCGTKVEVASPDQLATQFQPLPPPPAALPPTARASAPPAGNVPPPYGAAPAPQFGNPPSYGGAPTVQGAPPSRDGYAAQYAAPPPPQGSFGAYGAPPPAAPPQQFGAPPPAYTPGPPPPITPGGVAPWAQPQKRQGRRGFVVVGLIVVILLAACGGGAYALLHRTSKGSTTTNSPGTSKTASTGNTPSSGNTPGSGNTPVTNGTTQTLNNINRQAIYAGVGVTITSAEQADNEQDFSNTDPARASVLKVSTTLDNQTTRASGVPFSVVAITPSGQRYDTRSGPTDALPIIVPAQNTVMGAWYFQVPKTSKISDWKLVIGDARELPVTIPFTGSFDSTIYQQASKNINQMVKFDNGNITGTVLKIETSPWNPGYQPPQGMRFLRVYFAGTNNTAIAVNVGDGTPPQYLLIYPDGQRKQPEVVYGGAINDILNGGESKTLGFDSWLIPLDKASYKMVFLNPDGTTAGTVDFGTI